MKKVIAIALLAVGLSAFAQEEKQAAQKSDIERLSPEQRDQLHLKKLITELDLNESQQKEMAALLSEQSAKRQKGMDERKQNREKGVQPTADEKFNRRSQRMDDEKAMKDKVKKILTPEQYKNWEKMRSDNKEKMEKRMEKRADKKEKSE
jgi:adenylosuccinate synthase